jgi:radical SAM superfamily enzyme YgiQ (UPF0313 family)
MKVALVWPYGNDITYSLPLGIGYLIANMKNPAHEIRVFDGTLHEKDSESQEFQEFLRSFNPDVVGVSCWSKTFKEALKILAVAKEMNPAAVTVMGGVHPTAYPEKSIEPTQVDYLLCGEGEITFPDFVDRLAGGRSLHDLPGLVFRALDGQIVRNKVHLEDDLDKLAWPDYDAINLQGYIDKGYRYFSRKKQNAPIWATRGCPYHCKFCSGPVVNGHKIRSHSVGYLVNWIKFLYNTYGIRHINIIDDNFTFHKEYTREFCHAMIRERLAGLSISTANGIRAQRTDYETYKLMKQAGWFMVTVAPESGSPRVLGLMRKALDPSIWPEKIKEIRRAGLTTHAAILIGFPGETVDDIELTAELIRKSDFDSIGIQYFQPLPGTPIYDELVAKGEIEDELLPNCTTGARQYVTPELKDFNFAKFAFWMYMGNFLRRPMGTISEILVFPPGLIARRLLYLVLDALRLVGRSARRQ